jgi:hypothetical protein
MNDDDGIMGASRGLCCHYRAVATSHVPFRGGRRIRSEPVGVAFLRDSTDIAKPGHGLGLGLGGKHNHHQHPTQIRLFRPTCLNRRPAMR